MLPPRNWKVGSNVSGPEAEIKPSVDNARLCGLVVSSSCGHWHKFDRIYHQSDNGDTMMGKLKFGKLVRLQRASRISPLEYCWWLLQGNTNACPLRHESRPTRSLSPTKRRRNAWERSACPFTWEFKSVRPDHPRSIYLGICSLP